VCRRVIWVAVGSGSGELTVYIFTPGQFTPS